MRSCSMRSDGPPIQLVGALRPVASAITVHATEAYILIIFLTILYFLAKFITLSPDLYISNTHATIQICTFRLMLSAHV